jgi:hypothetical protein
MLDRLLSPRVHRDAFDRQVDLDEAFAIASIHRRCPFLTLNQITADGNTARVTLSGEQSLVFQCEASPLA